MIIYVVVHGYENWVERIYAFEEDAKKRCEELKGEFYVEPFQLYERVERMENVNE